MTGKFVLQVLLALRCGCLSGHMHRRLLASNWFHVGLFLVLTHSCLWLCFRQMTRPLSDGAVHLLFVGTQLSDEMCIDNPAL